MCFYHKHPQGVRICIGCMLNAFHCALLVCISCSVTLVLKICFLYIMLILYAYPFCMFIFVLLSMRDPEGNTPYMSIPTHVQFVNYIYQTFPWGGVRNQPGIVLNFVIITA